MAVVQRAARLQTRCQALAAYSLLVIRNDTPHKVGVGVAQCLHQACQLLLVELANGSEHALSRATRLAAEGAAIATTTTSSSNADNVGCRVAIERMKFMTHIK